jgi:hypothetical protein
MYKMTGFDVAVNIAVAKRMALSMDSMTQMMIANRAKPSVEMITPVLE